MYIYLINFCDSALGAEHSIKLRIQFSFLFHQLSPSSVALVERLFKTIVYKEYYKYSLNFKRDSKLKVQVIQSERKKEIPRSFPTILTSTPNRF